MGKIQIVVFCSMLLGTLYAPTMSHVFISQEIKIKIIKLLQNILFRSVLIFICIVFHCLLWSLTTELGTLSFVLLLSSSCHKLIALKNYSSLPQTPYMYQLALIAGSGTTAAVFLIMAAVVLIAFFILEQCPRVFCVSCK
jgi:hypothetical protein